METYTINPNGEIKLYSEDKKSFFGANSLLSIKAVRVPFEKKHTDIRLRIFYKNAFGTVFSFPLILYPPYFFSAVTPDFSGNMANAIQEQFSWVEIHNEEGFELTVSVSLNTKLHTDLNTFHKKNE